MNEVDVSEQELLEKCPAVLRALLKDHTRTDFERGRLMSSGAVLPDDFQRNIIWGTNCYSEERGVGFGERDEITEDRVTGLNRLLVQPRAVKEKAIQRQRSRDMAEVFTPSWVCNAQNNLVDDAWFGRKEVFNREYVDHDGNHVWIATEGPIVFEEEPSKGTTRSWQDYVRDVRLEISCGEAPYLVNRYDSVTGRPDSELNHRVGLLDRKLRVVGENTSTTAEWLKWSKEAVKSVYGFEWQGDNLLLAREAVLFTVIDYYRAKFKRRPQTKSLVEFAYIISWNLWQMDGLKLVLPYSCHKEESVQQDLFAPPEVRDCPACTKGERTGHNGVKCLIRDWSQQRDRQKIVFETLIQSK